MCRPKSAFALFLSLFLLFTSFFPFPAKVLADTDFKWRRINIPTEGVPGNWVLARGSDLKCLTRAVDGTLYISANPTGTTNRLFKSKDNGVTWSYTGSVTASIVDIATAPDNATFVYYATASGVYRSDDGGDTFIALPANPGGAGAGNVEITDIDVGFNGTNRFIAVATRDRDAGQFGGVYIMDESQPFSWQDTGIGGYDAYAVRFSPDFTFSRQLITVINDEVNIFVTTKNGVSSWGAVTGNIQLDRDNASPPVAIPALTGAVLAFPDNYTADTAGGNSVFFVSINTGSGNGDIYRINIGNAAASSLATDLNAAAAGGLNNVDMGSLAVSGKMPGTMLLAGSAQDARTYSSRDGGKNWTVCNRVTTGSSVTGIILSADFTVSSVAFAATSGVESAFSVSRDYGLDWNQLSLIDTSVVASGIYDFAPSPDYMNDKTVFLIARGNNYNLFRSINNGTSWERLTSSAVSGVDGITMVRLSPDYSRNKTVYLAGTGGGAPAIWRSTDNGEHFTRYSAPFAVDVMAAAGDNNLVIGGLQGGNAFVTSSTNGGFFFGTKVACGTRHFKSIALSPGYGQDKTILAGSADGNIYLSTDGGASFKTLPADASSAPLSDNISVAFDPDFVRSQIVYAASSTVDKGIYRFNVGKSQAWEKLDSTLPAGSSISQIGVSSSGMLYAGNFLADAGIERSVDPTNFSGASFEQVNTGLASGASLGQLVTSGSQVFVNDIINTSLMVLDDSLVQGTSQASPPDKAQGVGVLINHTVHNVSIDWGSISGATGYHWQLSTTTDFSSVPTGFEGSTEASRAVLPELEPATTYYWRVRATAPALSPWTDTSSFTTCIGEAVTAPNLNYPVMAARSVVRKPVFQWDAIAGAENYELIVSPDAAFASPVISRNGDYAIPGTAWESNVNLEYGTTYYWKVRGVSKTSQSAWSGASAFTTEEKPPSPTPVSPGGVAVSDSKPAPAAPVTETVREVMPGWGIFLIGGLVACNILLVIALLAIIRKVL